MRRLLRAVQAIHWYMRELTGEAAYEHYAAHARQHSPGSPPLTRREFERRRTDAREADPREGFRCC
jgi:uncharacterized short protein YbdD (DUF466 family)